MIEFGESIKYKITGLILIYICTFVPQIMANVDILIDPVTGKPSPSGVRLYELIRSQRESGRQVNPEVISFIKWEIQKGAAKGVRHLNSLRSSNNIHNDDLKPLLSYPLSAVFMPGLKSYAPAYVVFALKGKRYYQSLIEDLEFMGDDGVRYLELFRQHGTFIRPNVLKTIKYDELLKGFNKRMTLETFRNMCIITGSPQQVVERMDRLNVVKPENFNRFMEFMSHFNFPSAGEDIMVRLYPETIGRLEASKRYNYYGGLAVSAANRYPRLARLVIQDFKDCIDAAPVNWINDTLRMNGIYWCKLNGINDPGCFDGRKMFRDQIRYAVDWARITGDGDSAFDYIINNKKNKFVPRQLLDLLCLDCRLNPENRELIFQDIFTQYKKYYPLIMRHGKKNLNPQSYPAVEKVLQDTMGDKSYLVYYMVMKSATRSQILNADSAKIYHEELKGVVFPPNSHYWLEIIKSVNLLGFLFTCRTEDFFNMLWKFRSTSDGQELLQAGGPLIIPLLLKKINDKQPYTAIKACEVIEKMGTYAHDAAAAPLLAKLKASKNRFVRGAVIRTLGEIKAEEALPYLRDIAARETDKLIRVNASQTIMLFQKITLKDAENVIKEKYNLHRRN